MLSSTICLYSGSQDVLSKMYTSDFTMTTNNDISDGIYNKELDMANKVLSENNLTAADITRERYLYLYGERTENSFKANAASQTSMDDRTAVLIIIPLSDYKQMDKNCNISLKDNEAIACSKKGSFDEDSFSVDNQTFKIVNRVDSVNDSSYMTAQMIDTTYLIVNDTKLIDTLSGAKNGVLNTNDVLSGFVLAQELRFNINGDEATQYKIYDQLCNAFSDLNTNGYVGCNAESTVQFYSIYGGLFFIGIFLGALFIMAAVLIMYYKQISEGYDDKERFQIMQKVGMSKAEIKKSINSQVLMVFFLPLIVAIIHIAFAFPAITKLLSAIAMTNTPLFIICTGASIVGFAVIYAIVYALTAKSYYKIVE